MLRNIAPLQHPTFISISLSLYIPFIQANTRSVSAYTLSAIQSNANSCMPSAPLPRSGSPPRCCKHLPSIVLIGASLSEPHTYVKYATAVCMCIYIYIYMYICIIIYNYVPYVVLGHGTNLCRVQNGQDGRPLRSRCVRLKYSLRTASNEKEVVRNEAYAPTSQPGKNTGIVRRNSAN